MQVFMGWRYNAKIDKWVVCVFINGMCVTTVLRKSEEECKAWAERNLPIYLQGKMPRMPQPA